jgi:hypothetical protein
MISKILFLMGSFEFLVGLKSKIRKYILFSGSLKMGKAILKCQINFRNAEI